MAETARVGVKEAQVEAKKAQVEAKEAQVEAKAPSPALQPQNTFMDAFPFSPFMPNQSFYPFNATNAEGQEASSTMMWQAMCGAMTTKK